jgi:hypothetical protein|tara:strand:- start:45 stop:677 length:633 start_codon:yes stop_codon:yes gene_type:complete
MKPKIHIVVVIVIFFISSCSSSQVYDLYDARYNELLENIKLEPNLAAIKELRHVYVSTQRYKKNINAEIPSNPPFEDFLHKDLKLSLLKAYEVLDKNYTSLNGHYLAMATSFELGEKEQSKYHQLLLNILLEAIWASGDGSSISTAFFSTSTSEIDSFVELHGFRLISHTLIQIDDESYDQVRIKDLKTGQLFDWYFDISAQKNVTISIK